MGTYLSGRNNRRDSPKANGEPSGQSGRTHSHAAASAASGFDRLPAPLSANESRAGAPTYRTDEEGNSRAVSRKGGRVRPRAPAPVPSHPQQRGELNLAIPAC